MTAHIIVPECELAMDRSVDIRLEGLEPGSIVSIEACFTDDANAQWKSELQLTADASGRVSTAEAGEKQRDFLFWSMTPTSPQMFDTFKKQGAPPTESGNKRGHRMGLPHFESDRHIFVELSIGGGDQARATLARRRFPSNVKRLDVSAGRIRGVIYEPVEGSGWPGVVLISGSGGGVYREDAAQLASHGFSVFALGYFNYLDLPRYHIGVPLEYFREAIEWFRLHLGHDRIGVTGPSKGGEGSLAIAAAWPDHVKAAAPVVPGDLFLCAADQNGVRKAAWTLDGRPVAYAGTDADWAMVPKEYARPAEGELFNTRLNMEAFYLDPEVYERAAIPAERMRCPVLLIWAGDDQSWPSPAAMDRLKKRLVAHGFDYPVTECTVEDAGHFFTFPGYPTVMSQSAIHSLLPIFMTFGGTPSANALFQRRGWEAMIDFFHNALRP